MFIIVGTVEKINFIRRDLTQEHPEGSLNNGICVIVIQRRTGIRIYPCQCKCCSSADRRIGICQNPAEHLFLPLCSSRKQCFKRAAFIRHVIVGSIRKFIQTIDRLIRTAQQISKKLKYLIVVISVQPVSGCRSIIKRTVAFYARIAAHSSADIPVRINNKRTCVP